MNVSFECTYCGKKWEEYIYSQNSLIDKKCTICKDKNLKTKSVEKTKIDYYEGSPPFDKGIEDGWPYEQGSMD